MGGGTNGFFFCGTIPNRFGTVLCTVRINFKSNREFYDQNLHLNLFSFFKLYKLIASLVFILNVFFGTD